MKRDVHNLITPVQLRFRDPHNTADPSSGGVLSGFKKLVTKSTDAKVLPGVVVKFVEKLTDEVYLLANDRKILLIQVHLEPEDDNNVQLTQLLEVVVKFDIVQIVYEKKECRLVLCGSHRIELYKVDFRQVVIYRHGFYQTQKAVMYAQLYNQSYFVVFFGDSCAVLHFESENILHKQTMEYPLNGNANLQLLAVPRVIGKHINMFLYDSAQYNDGSGLFTIYKCSVYIEGGEFYMSQLIKLYRMQSVYKRKLEILNYDKDTILLNLKSELLVIKKHYPIDSGTLNYQHQNSFLMYLGEQTLMHICDNRVDAHILEVQSNSISIKSYDCLEFEKPKDSSLIGAFMQQDYNFIMFFTCQNNRNPLETKVWITMTTPETIKNKLQNLLYQKHKVKNGVHLSSEDLKDIQDVAEKMNLTKKQIFLELWNQSKRKDKSDFDILIQTEDYKTICKQLKKALKKECIKFTEVQRIQKACFSFLERQIKKPTPKYLRHYLKSHMMLRKYIIERMIYQQKQSKRQPVETQSKVVEAEKVIQNQVRLTQNQATQNKPQQKQSVQVRKEVKSIDRGYQLSVQDYITIRRRNIRNYLIDLLKIRTHESLMNLKQYITTFKFVLRFVFPDFLTQVISTLKQEFFDVLQFYPQLLPKPAERYTQAYGIWSDISSDDWQRNLYLDKLANVDNVDMWTDIIKTDKFRWDMYVRHDLVTIKKSQYEKQFLDLRNQQVFYLVLDLVYNLIHQKEARGNIVHILQSNYRLPEHLIQKSSLYWELHNLFNTGNKLANYSLSFKDLLKLKEQDIYYMVFNDQANCKHLVLNQIKEIYQSLFTESHTIQFYNQSIRSYFMSSLSNISDLKYILNRINNEKIEYHYNHENLYQVLVQAVYYKLQWTVQQPQLPISQIMIYFENIPLVEEQVDKLKRIQDILQFEEIFQKAELNMNLMTFFTDPCLVIQKITEFFIGNEDCQSLQLHQDNDSQISFLNLLQLLQQIRDHLFKGTVSDEDIMQTVLSLCMDFEELIPDLESIIYKENLFQMFNIHDDSFLETIISRKIDEAYLTRSDFKEHQNYIRNLINLLHNPSKEKAKMEAHLNLGLLLSILRQPPQAPIIPSTRMISMVLENESSNIVKQLDFDKIYSYLEAMGIEQKKQRLYEVVIVKFLKACDWEQCIKYTKLWNQEQSKITFSAKVIMKVAEELPKVFKTKLIELVLINYHKREQLLLFAQEIIQTKDSRERKEIIDNAILESDFKPEQFYDGNWILSKELKQVRSPHNLNKIRQFYDSTIRILDVQFQKNEGYYLYYRILLCQPFAAYEYHLKSFQQLDLQKLQILYIQLSNCSLFNSLELLMFYYKSLFLIFRARYCAVEFTEEAQQKLLRDSFEDSEEVLKVSLNTLMNEMNLNGYKDKHDCFRFIRRLYMRKKSTNNDRMSLAVESDREDLDNSTMNVSKVQPSIPKKIQLRKQKSMFKVMVIRLGEDEAALQQDTWEKITHQDRKSNLTGSQEVKKMLHSVNYEPKDLTASTPYETKQLTTSHYFKLRDPKQERKPLIKMMQSQKIKPNRFDDIQQNSESPQISKKHINYQQFSPIGQPPDFVVDRHLDKPFSQESGEKQPEQPLPLITEQSKLDTSKNQDLEEHEEINNLPPSHFSKKISRINKNVLAMSESYNSEERQEVNFEIELISNKQPNLKGSLSKKNSVQKPSAYKKSSSVYEKRDEPFQIQQKQQEVEKPNIKSEVNILYQPMAQQQVRRYIEQQKTLSSHGSQYLGSSTVSQYTADVAIEPVTMLDINPCSQQLLDKMFTLWQHNELDNIIAEARNSGFEIEILKALIRKIYQGNTSLQKVLQLVDKLMKISINFYKCIKIQNLRTMKNAIKAGITFDFKLIFPIDMLYYDTQQPSTEVEANNKALFEYLKPRLKMVLSDMNVFIVAKLMYLCFGYNKSYEFRVQYYYLQNLINKLVKDDTTAAQCKMLKQKIQILINKLPISMTVQRFDKLITAVKKNPFNNQTFEALLNIIKNMLKNKKPENSRYLSDIQQCESRIAQILTQIH